ncbi:CYTH domain-containing protein [Thalassomonas sp. RHCl1]|uniref:CYTH domain-containing protein n=1 Tax=Thalassomonas sp. RHCl1 TaxID=2995320 RepID=UPI00248B6EFA|nr:CYTH domain-containing protein [Thalassomonas sp. RHCl1]
MAMNKADETEIELKFLLGQVIDAKAVTELLQQQNFSFEQSAGKLKNSYFDTPALDLARNDIGLRIRSGENLYEQTVKTAGRVLSGLHQRPEYNLALDNRETLPKLQLFPSAIWPDGVDIAQIQQALTAIFTTDFYRTTWKIAGKHGVVIELVLDSGTIESQGRQAAIAEFELELFSGKGAPAMEMLFELANLLLGSFKLRPGVKSKAARGYALWRGAPKSKPEAFSRQGLLVSALADRESFYAHLDFALGQLQLGVEYCFLSSSPKRLSAVSEPLLFLERLFSLAPESLVVAKEELAMQFKQVVGLYSALELQFDRAGCDGKNGVGDDCLLLEFCYEQTFNRLQLALLKLLIDREFLPDGI